MPVRYVIADPEPPTWWARNKAWFCTVVGLLIGLYIGARRLAHRHHACTRALAYRLHPRHAAPHSRPDGL